MAVLTIRNVDAAVKERLRVRAAHNGRSMEAELRAILATSLAPDSPASVRPDLAETIRRRFSPFGGLELEGLPPSAMRVPSFKA